MTDKDRDIDRDDDDDSEVAELARVLAAAREDDDADVADEMDLPEEREVLGEADAMRVVSEARRGDDAPKKAEKPAPAAVAEESHDDEDKPDEDEKPAAKPDAPAGDKPAEKAAATPDAFLDSLPQAHRERVREAIEAERHFTPLAEMAVARGIAPAQIGAAVKTLVELNDFANRDLPGYFAHVATLTDHAAPEKQRALLSSVAEKMGLKIAFPDAAAPAAESDEDDDTFADPALKALRADLAEMKAKLEQRAQPQPQPQPAQQRQPSPEEVERAERVASFAREADPSGRPLRPYWGALASSGHIGQAIQSLKAERGVQALDATPETLGEIYVRAMIDNPATRAQGVKMAAAVERARNPAPSRDRGKGASKIIDAGQGAPKTMPVKPSVGTANDEVAQLAALIEQARAG